MRRRRRRRRKWRRKCVRDEQGSNEMVTSVGRGSMKRVRNQLKVTTVTSMPLMSMCAQRRGSLADNRCLNTCCAHAPIVTVN